MSGLPGGTGVLLIPAVSVREHKHVCGAKDNLSTVAKEHVPCLFEAASLFGLWLTDSARLPGHRAPRILLSRSPRH